MLNSVQSLIRRRTTFTNKPETRIIESERTTQPMATASKAPNQELQQVSASELFTINPVLSEDSKELSRLQKALSTVSPVANVLPSLFTLAYQSGLYRLSIPDPVLAMKFAQEEVFLTQYKGAFTTSLGNGTGYAGSAQISPVSKLLSFGSGSLLVLNLVAGQYNMHCINTQLSNMSKQLHMIWNHLEIQEMAKFNACRSTLMELIEDFFSLSSLSAGDLEKQTLSNRLSNVGQRATYLLEASRIKYKQKEQQARNAISSKIKVDEKSFEEYEKVILLYCEAIQLNILYRMLVNEQAKRWGFTTEKVNKTRLDKAFQEMENIFQFTALLQQIEFVKGDGIIKKAFQALCKPFQKVNKENEPPNIKQIVESFCNTLTQHNATVTNFVVALNSEENTMKILPLRE